MVFLVMTEVSKYLHQRNAKECLPKHTRPDCTIGVILCKLSCGALTNIFYWITIGTRLKSEIREAATKGPVTVCDFGFGDGETLLEIARMAVREPELDIRCVGFEINLAGIRRLRQLLQALPIEEYAAVMEILRIMPCSWECLTSSDICPPGRLLIGYAYKPGSDPPEWTGNNGVLFLADCSEHMKHVAGLQPTTSGGTALYIYC
jgi:hypothetical protein